MTATTNGTATALPSAPAPDATTPATRGRPPTAAPRPWAALLALVPAAAALAICLRGLGEREMWNNEYATWHAITLSLGDFEELLRRTDLVHVVYYMVMRVWIDLVGDTPFQLRIPSAVAMAACAGLVTLIARRLVGVPIGLAAGLLFAVIPAVSRYGQETRSYAAVTVAGAFATLMLLRALERPAVPRLVAYGVSVALMGLVHFVSLTVLAAHFVLWLCATRGEDDVERRWRLAFGCGFGLLGVIWLPAIASHQSASISWIKADKAAILAFPADMFLSAPFALVLGVLSVLGAAYLWFAPSVRNRPVAGMLLAWAVVPPVFVLVTFPVLHMFLPRYVLVVLPAWAILAATGAYLSGRLIWPHLGPATAVLTVAG
ncbi:glycosyltransferase family 39 protein, partial [Actinoplanes teichomyceticus]